MLAETGRGITLDSKRYLRPGFSPASSAQEANNRKNERFPERSAKSTGCQPAGRMDSMLLRCVALFLILLPGLFGTNPELLVHRWPAKWC